ncbi:MAG: alcohol dehydrogenase catalytic domain-containing protein, partial [Clostridia bacterium]
MRQAILSKPEEFELREVPVPDVGDEQLLIKVKSVGICGSDIHAYHDKHPFVHAPIVMGHEVSGEVVATGRLVEKFKLGDRVILRPQKACGTCRPCKEGRYNVCEQLEVLGCQRTGACSDYYAADAALFTVLPDNITYDQGAMIEPLAVGVHAVKRGLCDVFGKNILVIGAGTIGNLLAQSAKAMGAARVMITDVSTYKLELASMVGIDYPINVAKTDLKEAIFERFGSDGVDAVY